MSKDAPRIADSLKPVDPEKAAAKVTKAKEPTVETISVVPTGEFQLYDPLTKTAFMPKKPVEVMSNNAFVARKLEAKQLKKV